jgi:hypothetical protein
MISLRVWKLPRTAQALQASCCLPADAAGMQLGGRSVEQMQDFLAAAYGQRYSSSDEEEPDV